MNSVAIGFAAARRAIASFQSGFDATENTTSLTIYIVIWEAIALQLVSVRHSGNRSNQIFCSIYESC
jgi:hypothetical protein